MCSVRCVKRHSGPIWRLVERHVPLAEWDFHRLPVNNQGQHIGVSRRCVRKLSVDRACEADPEKVFAVTHAIDFHRSNICIVASSNGELTDWPREYNCFIQSDDGQATRIEPSRQWRLGRARGYGKHDDDNKTTKLMACPVH